MPIYPLTKRASQSQIITSKWVTGNRQENVIAEIIPKKTQNRNYSPGYDYISKAEFVPTGPGELRLKKGEKVKVLKQSVDESCLYVERQNEAK